MHEALIDNISFHRVENVERWKYVFQMRLALERELGKDSFEYKEVVDLIMQAGLLKVVFGFGKCYEMLGKESIVNIPGDCDSPMSKEFKKVFVKGKCVEFSPEVLNKFL